MLLILVVMWVAVLLPPYLRNRKGSGSANSMTSFRRKLDTLERATPFPGANGHVSPYLPVNNRPVSGPQPLDGPLPAGSRHPLQGGGGPRLVPMPSDGRLGHGTLGGAEPEAAYLLAPSPDLEPTWSEPAAPPAESSPRGTHAAAQASRAARKRRRDVLYTLLAACGITLLMALVLGTPVVLLFHVLCDVALAGYVYLLVSMQKSKAERDIKVAFLPHQNAEAEPTALLEAGGGWQPGELLRRSAN